MGAAEKEKKLGSGQPSKTPGGGMCGGGFAERRRVVGRFRERTRGGKKGPRKESIKTHIHLKKKKK